MIKVGARAKRQLSCNLPFCLGSRGSQGSAIVGGGWSRLLGFFRVGSNQISNMEGFILPNKS